MTNKTETWREACRKLQDDGVIFGIADYRGYFKDTTARMDFSSAITDFRIAKQPIPNRPDWREWCKKLQDAGVRFDLINLDGSNVGCYHSLSFSSTVNNYCIAQQPIPDNIGDLILEDQIDKQIKIAQKEVGSWPESVKLATKFNEPEKLYSEETKPNFAENLKQTVDAAQRQAEKTKEMLQEKPEPKDETPHRELQIQWHKDKLHSLETGEPMREWEYRYPNESTWYVFRSLNWDSDLLYRRKPKVKKVTYWHCVVDYGENEIDLVCNFISKTDTERDIECVKASYPRAVFTPITETTVEIEVEE